MVSMTRTNIDLDDESVEKIMKRHGFSSKREAVNFALKQLAGDVATKEEVLALRGIGWEGDLAEMRDFDKWDEK
jgi:Arc/MetJ family transcription regulator